MRTFTLLESQSGQNAARMTRAWSSSSPEATPSSVHSASFAASTCHRSSVHHETKSQGPASRRQCAKPDRILGAGTISRNNLHVSSLGLRQDPSPITNAVWMLLERRILPGQGQPKVIVSPAAKSPTAFQQFASWLIIRSALQPAIRKVGDLLLSFMCASMHWHRAVGIASCSRSALLFTNNEYHLLELNLDASPHPEHASCSHCGVDCQSGNRLPLST